MSAEFFFQVSFAGIIAAYTHLMMALWAHCMGLPRLDFPRAMARLSFNPSFPDGPEPYWVGFILVHLNGIVFTLFYAAAIGAYLPGPPLLRGLIWGVILFVASNAFFVPVFLRFGFFARKENPRAWTTSLMVHGIFGLVTGWLSPILGVTTN